jgi:hypothetical protein
MRQINWQPFRNSSKWHIDFIEHIQPISYDSKGKIYDIYDNREGLEASIFAVVRFNTGYERIGIVFTHNKYCHVFTNIWPGIKPLRLSSLPEHRYYFRHMIQLTTTDRDVLWLEIMG